MSFTAMGDGVNLASRLESLGKQYGTSILVSATIEQDARAAFWFRRLDRVAVHGKRTGVEIYERSSPRTSARSPRISRATSRPRSPSSTRSATTRRAACWRRAAARS